MSQAQEIYIISKNGKFLKLVLFPMFHIIIKGIKQWLLLALLSK